MDSVFIFTARRSVLAEHVIGEEVTLETLIMEDTEQSTNDEKTVVRSTGGAMETLFERQDKRWSIVFPPVRGAEKDRLQEFLDSTAGGEEFRAYLYGTEAAPLSLKRTDTGYSWRPWRRIGSESGDYFQASPITAVEV